MDGRTMRTLADCIREWRRRDRDNNRTSEQSGFDTTIHKSSNGDERDGSRDGGCDQNQPR